MYFRRLRYFEAVARCGSFSRASSELHVAQPALSSQIAELEADFGLQLFTRHSRGVALTDAGQTLLPRAEQVLELLDVVRSEMASFRSTPHGEVRLGLPTTITPVLTIPLLDATSKRMPGITWQVVEGMTGHLEKWLEQGDIDAAILFRPPVLQPHLPPVGSEGLFLIGQTNHELEERQEVTFADVARLPLIHTTRAHHLRRIIDEQSHSLRCPLNVAAEIDSLAQIKAMVFQSHGYTILPKTSVGKDWVAGTMRSWQIAKPELRINLFVVPSNQVRQKPQCRAALTLLENVVRELISDGSWMGASLTRPTLPVQALRSSGPQLPN